MLLLSAKFEVNIEEAYRYIGCRGIPKGETLNDLQNAAELIEENAKPRVVFKICDIVRDNGISLSDTCLKLEGQAVDALLHDSDKCIIFCATIGSDIDPLLRKWQIKDITFASMLDACASSAVESLCNNIENELSEEYTSQGCYLTDRFSPGYGDLSISIQKNFCAVLDTSRKIGVSVSESGIMIPRKSVTALIGISNKEQKHRVTGCDDCLLQGNCKYRENGVTCYGQII